MTASFAVVLLLIAPLSLMRERAPIGHSPERPLLAEPPAPRSPNPLPPAEPPEPPASPAVTCKLLTVEAPRGGRVEVEGDAFGKTPVVRIGGRIVRQLERTRARISAQIPRDSNGGPVTVEANRTQVDCGSLTITGKD